MSVTEQESTSDIPTLVVPAQSLASSGVVLPKLRTMWWEDGLQARSQAGLKAVMWALPGLVREAMRLAWRADRRGTLASLLLTLLSGVLSTVGLLTTQQVLIELFAGGPTTDRFKAAIPALVTLGLVLGVRGSLGIAVGWVQTGLEPKVTLAAQRLLFETTTTVDLSAFDEESFSDDMERAMGRGFDATMGLVRASLNLLAGLTGIIAATVAVGVLHPLLMLVLFAAMIPTAWAAMRAGQQQYQAYLASSMRRRKMWILGRLMADRSPAAELRAYTLRGFLLGQYDQIMVPETKHQMELARKLAVTNTIGAAITAVASIGVYTMLAWLLVSGRIPLAVAGTAVFALTAAKQSLRLASYQVDQLYSEGRHFRDFQSFLDRARHRVATAVSVSARIVGPLQQLRLTGVSLTYPDRDQPAVSAVDLTIHKGQTIALVGENGSGKTTLAAILCGLRAPDRGTVTWNGTELGLLDSEQVRARIAVVTQDHHQWPFSAQLNIALGDTSRDGGLPPIEAAARLAAAHDMILELPNGYDTLLDRSFEGGQDLSGGQWQRLVAARGFFRQADLLILDEPSSALDALAEDELFKAVRDRRGKASTILITHRLANVRTADQIFVMEHGAIVASGSHDELMHHPHDLYRRIFKIQAAGYADDQPTGNS